MGRGSFRILQSQFISGAWTMKAKVTQLILVCVFSLSCAHRVPLEAPVLTPVVEKARMRVAIVYEDSLRNFYCTASKGYIAEEWRIELGSISVAAFTPVFSAMFMDVVVVPVSAAPPGFSERYLIKLSLENFTGCDVAWPIFGSSVAITYSADVMLGSEMVLSAWTGSGESTAQDVSSGGSGTTIDEQAYLARLTTLAIRRAVADFLWKFEEDERVLAWKSAAVSEWRND